MDQQWRIVDKKITVKIDCIVNGNPSSKVNDKFLQLLMYCIRYEQ